MSFKDGIYFLAFFTFFARLGTSSIVSLEASTPLAIFSDFNALSVGWELGGSPVVLGPKLKK